MVSNNIRMSCKTFWNNIEIIYWFHLEKNNFLIFWSFWLHVRMYRLITQREFCWPNGEKKYLFVKALFNSRGTSIWITTVFSILAGVRFQEFSVLQPAKGPFFDFLTFSGARRLILVNMCWPDDFQINLTWKFISRGAENIFESC
jgi:hypothetical protein